MRRFVTANTLITADVRVSHRSHGKIHYIAYDSRARAAKEAGFTPLETWNKIFGLTLYCHICLHTFVFLASQVAFTSYDTTGTVVTQTYILRYHGISHRDSGETYNTMVKVVTRMKRFQLDIQPLMIPRGQW